MSKINIPDWLRWILVIPAAIGAYLGIQIVVAVVNSFSPSPEIFINIFRQIINSIAGPYCLVWVCRYVFTNDKDDTVLPPNMAAIRNVSMDL